MTLTHELEIELRKVVRFDLEELRQEFPDEWAECVEQFGDDALYEFVAESYTASPGLFQSTAFDSEEYNVVELPARPSQSEGALPEEGSGGAVSREGET